MNFIVYVCVLVQAIDAQHIALSDLVDYAHIQPHQDDEDSANVASEVLPVIIDLFENHVILVTLSESKQRVRVILDNDNEAVFESRELACILSELRRLAVKCMNMAEFERLVMLQVRHILFGWMDGFA